MSTNTAGLHLTETGDSPAAAIASLKEAAQAAAAGSSYRFLPSPYGSSVGDITVRAERIEPSFWSFLMKPEYQAAQTVWRASASLLIDVSTQSEEGDR